MREYVASNSLVYLIEETPRFELYTAHGEYVGEFTAPVDAELAADADAEQRVGYSTPPENSRQRATL